MTNSRRTPPRAGTSRASRSPLLGRFFGIEVRLHVSLLVLLAVLGGVQLVASGSFLAAGQAVVFVSSVLTFVLLHEFGHALMARRFGIATRQITLLPIGGVAELESMPEKPREELLVALAGPAVNLVLAAVLGLALFLIPLEPENPLVQALSFLVTANLVLFGFNLLPAFPMDGGRVLRALLATRTSGLRATEIAARIGRWSAVVMGLVGVFVNPFLLLIAAFVWMGATREVTVARATNELAGLRVGNAMTTSFRVLAPEDDLQSAILLRVRTGQVHVPIRRGDELVGLLAEDDLLAALAEGRARTVAEVMRTDVPTADPAEDLAKLWQRMQAEALVALPVVEDERLVGLITREDLQRFVTLQQALGRTGGPTDENLRRPSVDAA